MNPSLTDEGKTYPPVGRCIYCGVTGVPLYDEHILPAALQGRYLLREACCKPCEVLINREFEQDCLRSMFGLVRRRFALKSSVRSRRKRPVQPVRLEAVFPDGSTRRLDVKAGATPLLIHMPVFPRPTALAGLPPPEKFTLENWGWQADDTSHLLRKYGAVYFKPPPLHLDRVLRLVAKIAHSMAVAEADGCFEPLLPDLILGKVEPTIEFVGSIPEEASPKKPDHQIGLGVWRDGERPPLVVGYVRLFAQFGSPLYCAVVGKLTGKWPFTSGISPAAISPHILGNSPST